MAAVTNNAQAGALLTQLDQVNTAIGYMSGTFTSTVTITPATGVPITVPASSVTSGFLTGILQTLHATIVAQLAQLGITAS